MRRRVIFDAVRRMLGRAFRDVEVRALDRAIDKAEASYADFHFGLSVPRHIGPAGIALIKQFEGLARIRPDGLVEAYPDPATGGDPWTIGWGATGPGIERGTVWTKQQCDERLASDLARYSEEVRLALDDAPTSQAQFDALVSFHYNTGAIGRATLTVKHKEGDYAGAAAEYSRWVYAGGIRLEGLVRRREAEHALYQSG